VRVRLTYERAAVAVFLRHSDKEDAVVAAAPRGLQHVRRDEGRRGTKVIGHEQLHRHTNKDTNDNDDDDDAFEVRQCSETHSDPILTHSYQLIARREEEQAIPLAHEDQRSLGLRAVRHDGRQAMLAGLQLVAELVHKVMLVVVRAIGARPERIAPAENVRARVVRGRDHAIDAAQAVELRHGLERVLEVLHLVGPRGALVDRLVERRVLRHNVENLVSRCTTRNRVRQPI